MDRLSLAEAALAAAASRHAGIIVPDRVTSPMDCCRTVPVARAVVDGCSDRARADAAGRATPGLAAGAGLERAPGLVLDAEMIRLAKGDQGDRPPSADSRSA